MKILFRGMPLLLVIVLLSASQAYCQEDEISVYSKILHFPDRLFKKVDDKSADISKRLAKQSEKYLQRLAREEARLKKRLSKKDSIAAIRIFGDAEKQYADLHMKVKSVSGKASSLQSKYIPHLDTLKTAFNFIGKPDGLLKDIAGSQNKIIGAVARMEGLQENFNKAEEVKKYIEQRKQYLQSELGKYGLSGQLKKLKKQVYYYQAQVDEYKRMFDEPSQLEARAIGLLKKSSVFRDFFQKHSELAGLFRLPGGSSGVPTVSFAGLQTRDIVQQQLTGRLGSAPDVQQMMQQQVQRAKGELSGLKDRLNSLKAGSKGNGDPSMPDFKPNNQKTKRFKDRLELGSNLQTVKSNMFFPSTTDIGLSLGYKLNDKSIIGVGSSYKMGWGKDIRHISITHQGMGVRSFFEYKIKGSFWVSGGGEMNYKSQFSNFEILNDYSAWQRSALLGMSKKYQVSKKVKGSMQVLYDFLWREQVPRAQPVVFRVGYGFMGFKD